MFTRLEKIFTRKRLLIVLLLCAASGCGLAAFSAGQAVLHQQVTTERETTVAQLNEMLTQAQRIVVAQQHEYTAEREKIAQRLTQQASSLCGEVQVFLQATLIGSEAKNLQERLQTEQRKRDRLLKLAREQWETISGLSAQIRRLEHERWERQNISLNSFDLAGAPTGNLITAPVPPLIALPDFHSGRQLLSEISGDDAPPAPTAQWIENLLHECSLDLKHLLPKNSLLVIAEVGKQVMLTLGKEISADVSGSANIPLLIRTGDTHRQLVLQITVGEKIPPLTAADLAKILAVRLNAAGQNLRGLITEKISPTEAKIIAVFPEHAQQIRPQIPPMKVWTDLGDVATYYDEIALPENNEVASAIGLQITLNQPSTTLRLGTLVMQNSGSAAIFAIAGILLLTAFILAATLGWSAGDNVTVMRNVYAKLEHSRPQLGSLHRLQQANRNHAPASNILRTAKNKVLRDLALKVSPPPHKQGTAKPGKKLKEYGRVF